MNLLLVVLWAFAVPYSRFCHMASCLSTIWACIIIVCKMLYQLKIVNPQDYANNCSLVNVPQPQTQKWEEREVPSNLGCMCGNQFQKEARKGKNSGHQGNDG